MTRFRKVLQVLNELKQRNIIKNYAIGGGVAAYRYIEMPTKDLDVFIIVDIKGQLIHLSPIYEYLKKRGYSKWSGQFLLIEDYPVDFIPVKGIEVEAVQKALTMSYEGIRTKVFRPEYLIAISLKVGRIRDKNRARLLLSEVNLNHDLLRDILVKYNLMERLNEIKR